MSVYAAKWRVIPVHFPHVELDEWVIMPNHVHGIWFIMGIIVVGASPGNVKNNRIDYAGVQNRCNEMDAAKQRNSQCMATELL